MRLLDQWLQNVGTEEVLPLFEPTTREYTVPSLNTTDRDAVPKFVANVVWDKNLSDLRRIDSPEEMRQILQILNDTGEKTQLRVIYSEILDIAVGGGSPLAKDGLSKLLLEFLLRTPFLTQLFLESQLWRATKDSITDDADFILQDLLAELILRTNQLQQFIRQPVILVMQQLKQISMQRWAELVELIALTIKQPEFALDLLMECFEPESTRLLLGTPYEVERFVHSLAGIALDHIDEASSGPKFAEHTLSLERDGLHEGFETVKASVRLDAAGGPPKVGDHARLVAANIPQNAPLERPYEMDAIVVSSGQGTVRFRCLHHVPSYVGDCNWRVRSCGSFVTSKAMLDAVTALYATKSACCGIYNNVVGLRRHATEGGAEDDDFELPQDLNSSQAKALVAVTRHPLTLLWGPPGTGKTYTVVRILKRLLECFPEYRFLITAPTHNAVDNMMQRFIQEDGARLLGQEPLRVSTDVSRPELVPSMTLLC